jgi:Flp pilus assembly protein TadD
VVEAGVALGFLLLKDGKNKQALEIFSRTVELTPNDARALGGKAIALVKSGKRAEGRVILESALEKGPAEPLLYYEMGRLCEDDGAVDEALEYFKKGLLLTLQATKSTNPPDAESRL